jgi:hypothetical protein
MKPIIILLTLFIYKGFTGHCINNEKTIPELAELSDVIITFKAYNVVLSEHYGVFKNGIKKKIGTSIDCYGYTEKIIKSHQSYSKDKFTQFKIDVYDTKEYDSLGNLLLIRTPKYCEYSGDAFSVLSHNIYLCFLGINKSEVDTSFYLRRILEFDNICELHDYIGSDNEFKEFCKLQQKKIDEEKKKNEGIERLRSELQKTLQKEND